jgi:hypothetical protein
MATKMELKQIVDDVCGYFQTKLPTENTIELWLDKLADLNLRSSRASIVNFLTNAETLPRNFPVAVRSAYSIWLKIQPKICEQRGCDRCLSGLLCAVKNGYSYIFRCGHCRTSTAAYPEATQYWLTEQGYKLDWQHDYRGPVDQDRMKEIAKLARQARSENFKREQNEPDELPF